LSFFHKNQANNHSRKNKVVDFSMNSKITSLGQSLSPITFRIIFDH